MTQIKRAPSGHRCGESHHRAKGTDALVRSARSMREAGLSYTQIASRTGVHWRTVADWCNYATRVTA